MIIADTSGLLALFNAREPRHRDVLAAVEAEAAPLVVSPYVVAELDYLVGTRIGLSAELAMLRELAGPGYLLAHANDALLLAAADVLERFGDQQVGVTDASLVVLARRHRTDRILTLDHRHFTVLRRAENRPFTLLP